MEITFLGTGTSQGVPVIGCSCPVCTSSDDRDNRLRSSIMVSFEGKNYVVDSGPDFRQQMLREGVQKIESIFYTHEHKDHIAGLDDVRAFNFKHKMDMPLYAEERVQNAIINEFHYAFASFKYPGIPKLKLNEIDGSTINVSENLAITPIRGYHYKLPVYGFRFNDFTYITDMSSIDDKELEKVKGSKVLVINALRKEQHISHFSQDEALEIASRVGADKTYLTHISHYFGLHEEEEKLLPHNVFIAYDGLKIKVD